MLRCRIGAAPGAASIRNHYVPYSERYSQGPGSHSDDGAGQHPIAIQVIDRAMRLLDALAAQPEPVTLKELSATTGLHASTAHRILNDLVVGRYVERVDNGLYQLGMRLLELGSLVKGG